MIADRFRQNLDLLDEAQDILARRVTGSAAPAWCEERGWSSFLLGLDDAELVRGEHEGLGAVVAGRKGAPPSLQDFIRAAEALGEVEACGGPVARAPSATAPRRTSKRKNAQVQALAHLAAAAFPRARRIVDVGAGHGHLTRALAEALGAPALGLDRDAARVETARSWGDATTSFEQWEGGAAPLSLKPGDLAVGLHACGGLGDLLVTRAAAARADVLLVSCCLQKIEGDARAPLSRTGRERAFTVPRALLGLANLSTRAVGVEESMTGIMAGRQTRYALRLLLEGRGVSCAAGDEARGINRRQMRRGLGAVAETALNARGLPPTTAAEVREIEERATEEFGRIRRLSLPRAPLGRVLERAIVLDRAAALEEAGHETRIVIAFDADESPRNLAILGRAGA